MCVHVCEYLFVIVDQRGNEPLLHGLLYPIIGSIAITVLVACWASWQGLVDLSSSDDTLPSASSNATLPSAE